MAYGKRRRGYRKSRHGKRKFGRKFKRSARKLPAGLSAMRSAKRAAYKNTARVGGAHMATIAALQAAVKRANQMVADSVARK